MKRKDSKYKYMSISRFLIYFISIAELGVFFGSSSQLPIGSETFKRTKSLLQTKPEHVIDINDLWKKKAQVPGAFGSLASVDTYSRFCVPASNVDRKQEDGCMKKIRLERSLKLRREDARGRSYNILTNNNQFESDWLSSFGAQKEALLETFTPQIERTHAERANIACSMTDADRENEKTRVNITYQPRKNITHASSIRYQSIPKDNGIF